MNKKSFLKITIFVLAFFLFVSCDNEESYKVRFTGTIKYVSNNLAASDIPIKLFIINDDIPVIRGNSTSRIVLTEYGQSKSDGVYEFELNSIDLPNNASYIIGLDTDSLLQIDISSAITCMNTGSIGNKLRLRHENNDIFIDQPTFFQIAFNKIDHLSTDRVRYSDCLLVNETSMSKPDTTFIKIRPYFYFKDFHKFSYEILKADGEVQEYWIENIELRKGDTTRVYIEY